MFYMVLCDGNVLNLFFESTPKMLKIIQFQFQEKSTLYTKTEWRKSPY